MVAKRPFKYFTCNRSQTDKAETRRVVIREGFYYKDEMKMVEKNFEI